MRKIPRHIVQVILLLIIFLISGLILLTNAISIIKLDSFEYQDLLINNPIILYMLFFLCIIAVTGIVAVFWRYSNILAGQIKSYDQAKEQIIKKTGIQEILNETNEIEDRIKIRVARIIANLPVENLKQFTEQTLVNIAKDFEIVQALFFVRNFGTNTFSLQGTYAFYSQQEISDFTIGEGISGQVAKNMKVFNVNNVPEGYITILSGLGSSSPNHLCIVPVAYNNECIGIMELASFRRFNPEAEEIFTRFKNQLGEQLIKLIKK